MADPTKEPRPGEPARDPATLLERWAKEFKNHLFRVVQKDRQRNRHTQRPGHYASPLSTGYSDSSLTLPPLRFLILVARVRLGSGS